MQPDVTHNGRWRRFFHDCSELVADCHPLLESGHLTRVAGLVMEAVGLKLAVGSGCTVLLPNGNSVAAEVVGFSGDRLFLMPATDVYGLAPGAKVVPAEIAGVLPKTAAVQHPQRRSADCTKPVSYTHLTLPTIY